MEFSMEDVILPEARAKDAHSLAKCYFVRHSLPNQSKGSDSFAMHLSLEDVKLLGGDVEDLTDEYRASNLSIAFFFKNNTLFLAPSKNAAAYPVKVNKYRGTVNSRQLKLSLIDNLYAKHADKQEEQQVLILEYVKKSAIRRSLDEKAKKRNNYQYRYYFELAPKTAKFKTETSETEMTVYELIPVVQKY